jgi:nucleoside-diphosphate-sugar epimerase
MKFAVTGASGFIGSSLSRHLHGREHDVVALVRSPEKVRALSMAGISSKICDVTDPDALRSAFQGVDGVFHLAALFNRPEASWDEYKLVNVRGTQNVLEAALACKVRRVIHCSTVGVAVRSGNPPFSEATPYSPPLWDKYETTKCEAEQLVLDFGKRTQLPIVVIRPAQVYGPGDVSKAKFYRMVKKGVIVAPGRTLKHLVYVDDLCRAIELAMVREEAVGEIFIVAGEKPIALKDLIGLVASELGVPIPTIHLPAMPITWLCSLTEAVCGFLHIKPFLFRRSMDFFTRSVSFDASKAERELGFRAETDVKTGVAKTAAWYKQQGLL